MSEYFSHFEVVNDIRNELCIMHPDDLEYVLNTILPEGTDINITVKEINQWKQETNLDTMKK
jgi:hypothetical protein